MPGLDGNGVYASCNINLSKPHELPIFRLPCEKGAYGVIPVAGDRGRQTWLASVVAGSNSFRTIARSLRNILSFVVKNPLIQLHNSFDPVRIAPMRSLFPSLLLVLACAGGCQAGGVADRVPGGEALGGVLERAQALVRPSRRSHGITVPIPAAREGLELPPVAGSKDPSRPLIVIDPGHGGHDPGAVNGVGGHIEKDMTLALALALRDRLVRDGRLRVAVTREGDRYLALQERYDLARRLGADLFISLHADAADNDGAQGASIYTLSETASDREAARLAARENQSDIVNGINVGGQNGAVASILIDLSQRDAMARSMEFAALLHREAGRSIPFRQPYHRFASLVVLKAPDIPSVLFEAGYLTSAQDAARLASPQGRQAVADGVANAVQLYFARQAGAS